MNIHMDPQPPTMEPGRPPWFYRLVFLYLEPVSILAGAVQAYFFQSAYLTLTHASSAPSLVPLSTSIVLTQLANLYLGLAMTEALVLRVTAEYSVWRALIVVLLIADVGHLYSVLPLGFSRAFLQWWNWNAIDWGNVGWVYFLALTRICMLLGIGFDRSRAPGRKNPSQSCQSCVITDPPRSNKTPHVLPSSALVPVRQANREAFLTEPSGAASGGCHKDLPSARYPRPTSHLHPTSPILTRFSDFEMDMDF
ncbi:hypothetical protein ST47_g4094 [Ascochyta rabiei]|uniref:DUF7704 domain-containing protein n=1 Tax=Didymella rabiei TaxID=5454 RepID=A0A163GAE0_DIDRA|nr:hypothetical protein ST47_g4094 [Ascochyta rabiei]